jgi:predicted transglutaminase-like protease
MIEYPKKHSEAEIQSLLWYFLRKRKIDARLQVSGYSTKTNKMGNKLDLVVFVDKEPKVIVECKSWSLDYDRTAIYRTNNTKQIKKYKDIYKLPVLICARMEYVTKIIDKIQEFLNH